MTDDLRYHRDRLAYIWCLGALLKKIGVASIQRVSVQLVSLHLSRPVPAT